MRLQDRAQERVVMDERGHEGIDTKGGEGLRSLDYLHDDGFSICLSIAPINACECLAERVRLTRKEEAAVLWPYYSEVDLVVSVATSVSTNSRMSRNIKVPVIRWSTCFLHTYKSRQVEMRVNYMRIAHKNRKTEQR